MAEVDILSNPCWLPRNVVAVLLRITNTSSNSPMLHSGSKHNVTLNNVPNGDPYWYKISFSTNIFVELEMDVL